MRIYIHKLIDIFTCSTVSLAEISDSLKSKEFRSSDCLIDNAVNN